MPAPRGSPRDRAARTRLGSRYSRRRLLNLGHDRFDVHADALEAGDDVGAGGLARIWRAAHEYLALDCRGAAVDAEALGWRLGGDRKSTRLNSSHVSI